MGVSYLVSLLLILSQQEHDFHSVLSLSGGVIMFLFVTAMKKAFKMADDKRDAGLCTPSDIERWDDVQYGPDPTWQVLDVYRPKNAEGPLPVIVSIHGGGWAYGDKERYQFYCMDLAQRGFAVVNFTYRLAPDFKFPAGIEDTCLVFDWLKKQADCGWFDLNRVFAVGDSAGGHMLAIYCAACNDSSYASALKVKPSICPSAVGLNCGVFEIDMKKSSAMLRDLMRALLPNQGQDPMEVSLANPIQFINPSFPRAYVMTANKDTLAGPLAKEGLVYKLRSCGVQFVDRTYGGDGAGLNHVFHLNIRDENARKCTDDECRWFLEG